MDDESGYNLIIETNVALYLKEDPGKFLEEKKINDLIKQILNIFDIQLIYTVRKQRKKILTMNKMKPKQLNKSKRSRN
jgi:HSP90 family molecular chaperone